MPSPLDRHKTTRSARRDGAAPFRPHTPEPRRRARTSTYSTSVPLTSGDLRSWYGLPPPEKAFVNPVYSPQLRPVPVPEHENMLYEPRSDDVACATTFSRGSDGSTCTGLATGAGSGVRTCPVARRADHRERYARQRRAQYDAAQGAARTTRREAVGDWAAAERPHIYGCIRAADGLRGDGFVTSRCLCGREHDRGRGPKDPTMCHDDGQLSPAVCRSRQERGRVYASPWVTPACGELAAKDSNATLDAVDRAVVYERRNGARIWRSRSSASGEQHSRRGLVITAAPPFV